MDTVGLFIRGLDNGTRVASGQLWRSELEPVRSSTSGPAGPDRFKKSTGLTNTGKSLVENPKLTILNFCVFVKIKVIFGLFASNMKLMKWFSTDVINRNVIHICHIEITAFIEIKLRQLLLSKLQLR